MGSELPKNVNLPKFVWQKGSPARRGGGGKPPKKGCAVTAIGLVGGSLFGLVELVRTIVS
jgi:hypothetical protein